jgi:aminoglycoside 3-N-acetyltransferase
MASTSLKRRIKRQIKALQASYARRFRAYGPNDLAELLARLGVQRGDVVLAHSAWDRFLGFTGKPLEAITVLQNAVGREGILAMPTLPFGGTAIAWAQSKQVFDVRRTPSQMGLLTELFRRSPGVVRSLHPTHSVAAWGDRAAEFVAGHQTTATPCGAGSPYAKLEQWNGKILLLGTGIGVLTFFHRVEEDIETLMPFSPFTAEIYVINSRDAQGATVETRNRLFDPAVSRRRDLGRLMPALKRDGSWREARAGGLDAIALEARRISAVCHALAERGEFLYEHDR